MRNPTVYAYDDRTWQIPDHDVAVYSAKRHAHALVIPVINEGERIRAQLLRVQAAQLPVDVIIADGGSTDGSLDAEFVTEAGVSCVLTKTGPGKLSAQLRMAYAWCVRQGYDGLVTIDGNGKDGVEAVRQMVAKLEAGYDYVQGSRYLPGGEAENTPLERTIANRLIHAPLLSFAGRHWFTDTTNGFRGYSIRYLMHPEVHPFREEFQIYNLLFYLTVRAGQLGLKVGHCPVVRRYPDSGNVPTKIGGLGSKLALLGETVTAATGGYTPNTRPPQMGQWALATLIACLVALPLFLSVLIFPPYSPDSWSFYELSQAVFGDFYRGSTIRSYASDIPYSAAFPPLWPALIAVVDAALGTGARTGLYLAFASFIGFALVSERIGRRLAGARWIGLVVGLAMLLGPKMVVDELTAGRTIPLQMLLYALTLLGLLRGPSITITLGTALGMVTGLAILNRFDALPLPFLVAAMVWWMTRRPLPALAVVCVAGVAVSPWVAYSLTTFGTVFATDNAGIAASLDPEAFVTDWWPELQPSVFDDPAAWSGKALGHLPGLLWVSASALASPLGFAFAMALTIWAGVHFLATRAPGFQAAHNPAHSLGPRGLATAFGFLAITATLLIPQILTGYLEYRYLSAFMWAGFMTLIGWAICQGISDAQRRVYARIIKVPLALWILAFTGLNAVKAAEDGRLDFDQWAQLENPADVAALAQCLGDQSEARVLVMGDDTFAAKAGALGSLSAMMEPRNMVDGRLSAQDAQRFLTEQRVDFALTPDASREVYAKTNFDLGPRAANCPLPLYPITR